MRKVLILEDSAPVREALRDLLEMEGFSVRSAESVQEARELEQKQGPFHAYLLDGNVHGPLRGEVFARELLDAGGKHVIVISAEPQKGKAPNALYIRKPLRFEEILEVIK